MSDSERWQALVAKWRAKQDAMLSFPLFEGRMMRTDLVPEYEKLAEAEREAREEMDQFIAAYKARLG